MVKIHKVACFPILTLLITLALVPHSGQAQSALDTAERLTNEGRAQDALAILRGHLDAHPRDGRALVLRSTVYFLLEEPELGRADLELALKVDPAQRQGWLNYGALALAEGRSEDALSAFEKARDLDPGAADAYLNLGATQLLMGDLTPASQDFATYLKLSGSSGEASFLVAKNYALAGYSSLALQHLQTAILRNERVRRLARTDPAFDDLVDDPRFQQLLNTDSYRPPEGARQAARRFEVQGDASSSILIQAVVDALQILGEPFDPTLEGTPDWVLIWGDMRIKILRKAGVVELSTTPDKISAADWKRRTDRLFETIWLQLQKRSRGTPRP